MSREELDVVRAWHAALNDGDVERLVALSTDDIEVGGPRGTSSGGQVLREWFGRAGIRLEPGRINQRDAALVVEQSAAWRSAEAGDVTGQQGAASVFAVRDGRVASVVRYPDLATALAAAGMTETERI